MLLSLFSDGELLRAAGSGVTLAFAFGAVARSNTPEGVLTDIRRWRGSIDDKFSNIKNLVDLLRKRQTDWMVPAELLQQLSGNCTQLQEMITLCRTSAGSTRDCEHRNILLKSTVELCLHQVKLWAYGKYAAGIMTVKYIHNLGFPLPGENGGRHERIEATRVMAEVKVRVLSADLIRVVIDQSGGKNAALTAHGWPGGV
ncbi:MAG: hypothetical protein LBL33_07400 [Tannerella sp.]|jgi:hypothetical protein|nr:hypothetical protein [Tannerella sp.]